MENGVRGAECNLGDLLLLDDAHFYGSVPR